MSAEQAQRLARRSAEVRREKARAAKSAREFAIAALNAEIRDKETGNKYTAKDIMIRKLITRAINDTDLYSIKYLLELIGESPADYTDKVSDIPTDVNRGVDIDAWIKKEVGG